MKLNRTDPFWDRETRNDINDNWDILENVYNIALSQVEDRFSDDLKELSKLDFKNEIRNGDFSNGDSYWHRESGTTISASENKMNIRGDGTNVRPRMVQIGSVEYDVGDKVFLKAIFTSNNTLLKSAGFAVYSDVGGSSIQYITDRNITRYEPKEVYGNIIIPEEATGQLKTQIRTEYESIGDANGRSVDVEKVMVINLTKEFGEGKEPGADNINQWLNKFVGGWFDDRPKSSDSQKATINYLFNNHVSPTIDLRKPIIAITFDDGFMSDYDVAFPILKTRGIVATSFVITGDVGVKERRMDWHHLHELKNAGWGIEDHTVTHRKLAELTDEEIRQEMEGSNQAFIDNGFPIPRHLAYPLGSGSNDERVHNIVAQYRKTARMTTNPSTSVYNLYNDIDMYSLQARGTDIRDDNQELIQIRKNEIDEIVKNRGIGILFSHEMLDDAGDYETKTEFWKEIIDYAINKDVEFVTMDQLYKQVLDYRIYTNSN